MDGTKDMYEYFEDGRDGRGTECGRGEERLRPDGRRNANNEFRLRELRGTEYRGELNLLETVCRGILKVLNGT